MRFLRLLLQLMPIGLILALSANSPAQTSRSRSDFVFSGEISSTSSSLKRSSVIRLSPDAALATYERGVQYQSAELAGYTATTVIDAELPSSAQKAQFELKRHYTSPAMLEFTPLRFSGDKFVKTNIIVRLLQSEVDRVHRHEQAQTAITSDNYKFIYKGLSEINGAAAHIYEVKPRQKRVGLFKGKISVDAQTGRLLRAEGRIVKSPSLFIKKIDFSQDYATIAGFTLPIHLHSEAETRLVGKTIVDITQRDYQPQLAGGGDSVAAVSFLEGTN